MKAYPARNQAFEAESAGLASSRFGPRLLAVDAETPLLVMEDLGDGPSLADLLLGDDSDAAHHGLLAWADALGRMCADSLGSATGPGQLFGMDESLRLLTDRLSELDIPTDGLDELLTGLREPEYLVFSPGDACPDNNVFTPGGVRFLDFESAGVHSVFLDAAYTRMPFATCWCVFGLPAGMNADMETAFRRPLVEICADLADDACWDTGVRRACVAWTLANTAWFLPPAITDPSARIGRFGPRRRAYLAHRWERAAAQLEDAGDLPEIATVLRALMDWAARKWTPTDRVLQPYPAFRDRQV